MNKMTLTERLTLLTELFGYQIHYKLNYKTINYLSKIYTKQ